MEWYETVGFALVAIGAAWASAAAVAHAMHPKRREIRRITNAIDSNTRVIIVNFTRFEEGLISQEVHDDIRRTYLRKIADLVIKREILREELKEI